MNHAFSAIVRGRVQGVGFRYFTREMAVETGVAGWVRNNPDGTVEIHANGSQEALERFMHYLRMGPTGSRVDQVDSQWFQEKGAFKNFEIL